MITCIKVRIQGTREAKRKKEKGNALRKKVVFQKIMKKYGVIIERYE